VVPATVLRAPAIFSAAATEAKVRGLLDAGETHPCDAIGHLSSVAAEEDCWADYQSEGAASIGVTYDEFDDTCYRD
jgi:hypothetical protein